MFVSDNFVSKQFGSGVRRSKFGRNVVSVIAALFGLVMVATAQAEVPNAVPPKGEHKGEHVPHVITSYSIHYTKLYDSG